MNYGNAVPPSIIRILNSIGFVQKTYRHNHAFFNDGLRMRIVYSVRMEKLYVYESIDKIRDPNNIDGYLNYELRKVSEHMNEFPPDVQDLIIHNIGLFI